VDADVAVGSFPVVLFSHGLDSTPSRYESLLTRWAAAGFVVAAPTHRCFSPESTQFNLLDAINHPADASTVLDHLIRLNGCESDPLHRRLDVGRLGAAGHSAGGITTTGLLSWARDGRLGAAVVLAGDHMGVREGFAGAPVPVFFAHGDADSLVSHEAGRRAYGQIPWPKAFLSVRGGNHIDPYRDHTDPAFPVIAAATTDFLRLSLYGDAPARARLAAMAGHGGQFTLDDRL
jgi:predicted dienelactone hydrolase